MKMIKCSDLATLLLLLTCCDNQEHGWTGWVNPSSEDRTYSIRLNGFETFEQCQKAATDTLQALKAENGTFQCGHKCEWDDRVRTDICEIIRG